MHLLIIGAGGHSKVVAEAARSMGVERITILDELAGQTAEIDAPDATHFIVAIGDNKARSRVFEEYLSQSSLKPFSAIHATAFISDSAQIGAGTFVGPRAVVHVDAKVGLNAIVNTAAVVEHDCVLDDHAFVAPSSSLCGGAKVGVRGFVGTNATMLPLSSIGEDSILGAGSVLKKSLGDRVVAVGAPARVIKSHD